MVQEEATSRAVVGEEAVQEIMTEIIDMKTSMMSRKKKTQVGEEEELGENISTTEVAIIGIAILEEMTDIREVRDKIEEMEEKMTIEIITEVTEVTETNEDTREVEDMAVETASQGMDPEATARRLEVKESLL